MQDLDCVYLGGAAEGIRINRGNDEEIEYAKKFLKGHIEWASEVIRLGGVE